MIAEQRLGTVQENIEVTQDQQAAAAQEAEAAATAQAPEHEQKEAVKALEERANTRRTVINAVAAVACVALVTGGAIYEFNNGFNAARDGASAIGRFVKGLLPHQDAELQVNDVLHSLQLPTDLPLEKATGTAGMTLNTHVSINGYNLPGLGSHTPVSEAVTLNLSVPNRDAHYKVIQDTIQNDAGGTTTQWRLEAIIDTERLVGKTAAEPVSTLEYTAESGKIIDQQATDGFLRRLGQVVTGSDADKRLKLVGNQDMERFAVGCAPVLESVLSQAAAHAVQQQFASVLALKDMAGLPKTVTEAIDEMTSHAPIIEFRRADGSVVSAGDVQIPLPPVDSQNKIANILGMDPKSVDITPGETCALDANAIHDLTTTLIGQGK